MIKKDKTNQEMIKLSKELKTELTEEVKLKKKELKIRKYYLYPW